MQTERRSWIVRLIASLQSVAYSGMKTDMRSSELTPKTWKYHLLRGMLATVAAAAVLGGVYWFIASQQPDFARAWGGFKTSDTGGTVRPAGVELIDLNLDALAQTKTIRGKVKNSSDQGYDRVEVTFALTNANGSQVDSRTISVSGVAAKSAKPFEVSVNNSEVSYYMVRDVVAF